MEPEKKRRVGRWIVAGIFVLIILGYNVVFSTAIFQRILLGVVSSALKGGSLSLTVEQSSLFRGFDFKDVKLLAGGTELFKAERLRISYFLPSILIGHVGVRDLSILRPEIFLIKENGKWNYSALGGSDKEEKEEKKDSKPFGEKIATYIGLKLYAKAVIKDLHFVMDIRDPVDPQYLEVDHFSVHAAFITRTFTEIPLSARALNLFDTLIVGIAPDRPVHIVSRGSGQVQGDLELPFFLYREAGRGDAQFSSRFHLNTANLVLSRAGRSISPSIRVFYGVHYDSINDQLNLKRLFLEQNGDPWIDLTATIDRITSQTPTVHVSMLESKISLDSLGGALDFLGVHLGLTGNASIYPLKIDGPVDRVAVQGRVKGNSLAMKTGKLMHRVPELRLELQALMNIRSLVGLAEPEQKESSQNLAFGIFRELHVPELFINYNGATIRGLAEIMPGSGVTADLNVAGLRLTPFSAPAFDGLASAHIHFQSPEDFRDLSVKTELRLEDSRFLMSQNRSGPLLLSLTTEGLVGLHDETEVKLDKLVVTATNAQGANALTLRGNSVMNFGDQTRIGFHMDELRIAYSELHASLPANLRYTLGSYRSYLDGGVNASGDLRFKSANETSRIETDLSMAMPGIHLTDLKINSAVALSENLTTIDSLRVRGLKDALDIGLFGKIKKTNAGSEPDLTANLKLASQQLFSIHKNLALQGDLKMDLRILPGSVQGLMAAKDLSLEITQDCDAATCHKFRLEKLNLNLPIFHDMNLKTPVTLADSPTGLTFDTPGFLGDPNLTVQFIASSHNPRGELMKDGYFYAGSLLPRDPGLSALLEYRKNVLYFKWLRYQIYRPKARTGNDVWVADGRIEGRDIFFNLADMTPPKMEFGGRVQVKNLDLEPFLPASQSSYDGIISAEVGFQGKNLDEVLYNTTARLSVYRLSREFSGFATRIVMPGEVAAFILKSAIEISAITLELQNGLVYSTIGMARRGPQSVATTFLSFVIKPTGEEIRQERIPLAQFLERAKSEVRAGVSSDANPK